MSHKVLGIALKNQNNAKPRIAVNMQFRSQSAILVNQTIGLQCTVSVLINWTVLHCAQLLHVTHTHVYLHIHVDKYIHIQMCA